MESSEIANLRQRVAELEAENAELRRRLSRSPPPLEPPQPPFQPPLWQSHHDLTQSQVERYGRQLVLDSFGVQAQEKLCRGSAVVIGAGGLGASAILYLAAAGIGRLGIVDRDSVALSNLHRQIIHTEASVGKPKTESAQRACQRVNSSVTVEIYSDGLNPENALEILQSYDVVLDASDNVPTRYLISDACVVTGKPLVSGAAIGTSGQLTVYNYGSDGPCYRCLFPKAPSVHACSSCAESGVLGPVPGVIGILQALEAVKILSGIGKVLSQKLLFADFLESQFRTMKLRGKHPECIVCSSAATLTRANLTTYDYHSFTGQPFEELTYPEISDRLQPSQRITPEALMQRLQQRDTHPLMLLDVRTRAEFGICHIKGSVLYPYSELKKLLPTMVAEIRAESEKEREIVVICRRGHDSQFVAEALQQQGIPNVVDLRGGLEAWHDKIDPSFLKY